MAGMSDLFSPVLHEGKPRGTRNEFIVGVVCDDRLMRHAITVSLRKTGARCQPLTSQVGPSGHDAPARVNYRHAQYVPLCMDT